MKTLCALYDRATEAYAPIMTTHTRNEALRSFRHECQNKESPIAQHPTDYELHVVGQFNDQTGEIIPHKELLARAEDHVS